MRARATLAFATFISIMVLGGAGSVAPGTGATSTGAALLVIAAN